jgi:Raf kinase inhibitor-like YbhB/YbcL family protein
MELSSPEFKHEDSIPRKFTCEGDDVSPTLAISGVPAEAVELALIVDDPDAPGGTFVHWVQYNMPITERIDENTAPGTSGVNDFGKSGYGGPCPPSGTHRYNFKLYALNEKLDLPAGLSKSELEGRMEGRIIDHAVIVGRYAKGS